MNVSTIEGSVEREISHDVSPYQLAKAITKIQQRTMRPQMMYNYVSKNLIPSYRNQQGHLLIDKYEARKFARKYLAKHNS